MIKNFLIVFVLVVLTSCSGRRIIPEKTLVEIIYRMQLVDAVLSTRESHTFHKDSMRIYEPVIEKFGYTIDDLHRTLLKHIAYDNELQSIISQIIEKIKAEKDIYQEPARIEKLSENMNIGSDSISIVSRTVNKHSIEISLSEQGVYDVAASYFFYKNDSTENPKMAVWLESKMYKDSIIDRQEVNLVKDTVFTDYSLRVRFYNPSFNILKIYWIDFEQKNDLSKSKTVTSLPVKPVNNQTVKSKKKTNVKIKPDITTRQHFIIKRKSVKYNFEESDTVSLKERDEFIGPLLPEPLDSLAKRAITDSVVNIFDTVNRIMAIKRKDSIKHGKLQYSQH